MDDLRAGSDRPGPHVLVLGGGASGVLMAAHLLAQPEARFRVTLVEGKNAPGQGLAYATQHPEHLLNTRVHNMSAFPDAPHHFEDWLQSRPEGAGVTGADFVSRATYGAYLADLLNPWADGRDGRLRFLPETAVGLTQTAQGVSARLSDGRSLMGDHAVLATGHALPSPDPQGVLSDGWLTPEGLDPEGEVVILGTGLSMVDQVLTLLSSGHQGPIVALSRRGQMPRPHAGGKPLAVARDEVPLGAPVSWLTHWVRGLARRAAEQGGTWRDAVDGIRPHVQAIWRALPQADRARFLRHAATWWDVHRHRIPPASEARITVAILTGQLRLIRGSYAGAGRDDAGALQLRYRPYRQVAEQVLRPARILDCRGIRRDPGTHASPLIGGLLDSGAARIDPLRIGLDVTPDSGLIGAEGAVSDRLHAIGPVARAALWEITAIPDIRVQVADLARRLAIVPVFTAR